MQPNNESLSEADQEEGREVLPPPVAEILKEAGVNPDDPKQLKAAFTFAQSYGGPIPPPSMLAGYDDVVPGLSAEIVAEWKSQKAHRQNLENLTTSGDEKRMDRAQMGAWGIACLGIVASVVAGYLGATVVGSIIAIVTVGGPAAATVLARYMALK